LLDSGGVRARCPAEPAQPSENRRPRPCAGRHLRLPAQHRQL